MLVFWWAVCSEQVAIQISICCLSKRLFIILEHCELTAMASNITSVSKREKVISLCRQAIKIKKYAQGFIFQIKLSPIIILSKFLQNGTVAPEKPGWKGRTIATLNVVEFVEYCKDFKPSTWSFEIQQDLLAIDAICSPANLPARSISDIVRQDLQFTAEKTFCPSCRIFNSWKSSENFERICQELIPQWFIFFTKAQL